MKKLVIIIATIMFWSCSSETIETSEKIVPLAVDDTYNTIKNKNLIMSTLLDNDKRTVKETVISFEESKTTNGGTIEKNYYGTPIYTPKHDFVGTDTFTYTICNDDSSKKYCSTAKITITVTGETTTPATPTGETGTVPPPTSPVSLNIPTELKTYYTGINSSLSPSDLKSKLKTIISNYTKIEYYQRHDYLYSMDSDLDNSSNVTLMYTGVSVPNTQYMSGNNTSTNQTFNTEHVYPKSKLKGGKNSAPKSDLHHLRSCDASVNSKRGNKSFVDGSGANKVIGDLYYPGDEWKGDVARMVMYLNVMHGESFDSVGSLDLFLKWNKEDPVSAFEKQRNKGVFDVQKNRNPFIDNPYLATLIYGGNDAENLWE